jgi:hypothetical protein
MNASPARVGSLAGWLTLAAILGFEIIVPQVIAGQRVSGTTDIALIQAYYGHPALAPVVGLGGFVIMLAFLPFATALRGALSVDDRSRFLATTGLAFAVAAAPLYVAKSAVAATLVTLAGSGADVVPLFRFWDLLYNGGIYALEAGWILGFGLAAARSSAFPRWFAGLTLLTGILQLGNMTALFVGIPDTATLPGNVALAVWLGTTSFSLGRLARAQDPLSETAAA